MTSFLKSAALVALCALASCTKPLETASYSVVPLPSEVTPSEGTPFRLNSRTSVFYPTGNALLKRNAEFLSEYVAQSMNFALPVREQAEGEAPEHAITLVLDSTINNEEGYRLSVTEKSIRIEGRTEQGIFYGIQTLRKSLPAVAESKSILLPAAVVNDEPRFTYRAMHLDVCRHFFPVEFVKKYIDLLALQRSSGQAALYKYGAAPSYCKRGGSVSRYAGQSLPAGLQAVRDAPECTRLQLTAGSFFVMVSDGIADAGNDEWLQNLLAGWSDRDVNALVSLILAESRGRKGLEDDCAVLALHLSSGEKKPV